MIKFWNSGVSIKISRNKEKGKSLQRNLPAQIHPKYLQRRICQCEKQYILTFLFRMSNYSCILIGSYLWSNEGQMHGCYHQHFFMVSLLDGTSRFHASMCLFRNKSEMTSKRGMNISDTSCVLTTSDTICDLLPNRHMTTWNVFVNLNLNVWTILYYAVSTSNIWILWSVVQV